MALLKKTVVLTNNGAEGYITVVRVGDEVGAKIVGTAFEKGMLAAIKIGTEPVFYAKLVGARTEVNLRTDFNQNDDISCIIIKDDKLIAKAGRALSAKDLIMHFDKESEKEKALPIDDTQTVSASALPLTENNVPSPKESVPYADEQVVSKRPAAAKKSAKTKEAPDIVAPTVAPQADMESNIDSESEKEFLSRLHSNSNKNFYQNVKERLDDLFVIHPRENELESIIPESKWVKIRYDGDDYYVVGSLTDDGTVSYLAYGVPGVAEIPPPKLASDISDWLPVPNLPPPYQGYWLIFQNALDGKVSNIK